MIASVNKTFYTEGHLILLETTGFLCAADIVCQENYNIPCNADKIPDRDGANFNESMQPFSPNYN